MLKYLLRTLSIIPLFSFLFLLPIPQALAEKPGSDLKETSDNLGSAFKKLGQTMGAASASSKAARSSLRAVFNLVHRNRPPALEATLQEAIMLVLEDLGAETEGVLREMMMR